MNAEMTVSKAAELAGLTPGQVSSFIFAGLVTPEVHSPNGSGDHSVLSPKNIKELQLIGNLTKIGLKTATIGGILELLANSKMNWWNGGDSYVVFVDGEWFITDNVLQNIKRMKFNTVVLVKLD
jgi:DNA-binding transcriptional MerR regulator